MGLDISLHLLCSLSNERANEATIALMLPPPPPLGMDRGGGGGGVIGS